jgi:hypothetical protein
MHTHFRFKAVKSLREPLPVIRVFNRPAAHGCEASPAIVEGWPGTCVDRQRTSLRQQSQLVGQNRPQAECGTRPASRGASLPPADVDVALPGNGRDVLNGEVAPRCLGNVHFIGSGNHASFLRAWVLLLFWRGELNCVKADRFQSWDVGNSRAGLQSVSPWCPDGAWDSLASQG